MTKKNDHPPSPRGPALSMGTLHKILEDSPDIVNEPSHYAQYDPETIDFIKSRLSPEEYRGYLKGNIWKYMDRYQDKDCPVTDLQKCENYLGRLIAEYINDPNNSIEPNRQYVEYTEGEKPSDTE